MQGAHELRDLAAQYREHAKTATEEGRAWRISLAEYLENLATEIERIEGAAGK